MDVTRAPAAEVRFAMVGTGVAARYHAQAIARTPGARLVAVCRSDPARAAEAAHEFGVACASDPAALLARADVDAVCICTPSGQHAAQCIEAARAGKHVLVEKPMALTLEDADAMIAACASARVRLGIALQRRTEPVYGALREALGEGRLGRPVLGVARVPYRREAAYYGGTPWRGTWSADGGGALMNQGIHLLDLLLWLLGDLAEVRACAATLAHSIEAEDCVTAALRFRSGALGALYATTAAAPGFPHAIEVYGTAGGAQIEGESVVRWEVAGAAPAASAARAAKGSGASATGLQPAGHARLLADFVAAVREQRPPLVDGAEGRRSVAAVLAVYESARSGRPVSLAGAPERTPR